MKKFVITTLAIMALISSVNAGRIVPANEATFQSLQQYKEGIKAVKALKGNDAKEQVANTALTLITTYYNIGARMDAITPGTGDVVNSALNGFIKDVYGFDISQAEDDEIVAWLMKLSVGELGYLTTELASRINAIYMAD